MSAITTHVLDTAMGRPAAGVAVHLERALGDERWATVGRAETDADGRRDRQEPGLKLAVAHSTCARKPHELRAPVLWVVDEFHEPLGRQLIRQPLHALAAGGSHLGDLRHGEWAEQREASHEAERAATPAGDEPGLLTHRPYTKEALGDLPGGPP